MTEIDRYAVIGNPIEHSRSPQIHTLFAKQTGHSIRYDKILGPKQKFVLTVNEFISAGGKGLNVTLPFKLEAYALVDELSSRAQRALAVNTIIAHPDGVLFGDNTDGVGLLRDLSHNHHSDLKGKDILILGAGGAVRGILEPLLSAQPSSLVIANRTTQRALELADDFTDLGPVTGCGLEDLSKQRFNLIINGTSASIAGTVPDLPEDALLPGGWCYDMFYSRQPTAFVRWGIQHGAAKSVDGLGMLVEQAAESFWLWRGIRPDTFPVIKLLNGA